MEFYGYAPPVPAIMGTAWTIFEDGIIDQGTSDRLQKSLTDNQVPYSSRINLNSDGGSLGEGMKLGNLIRKSELFTYVGRSGEKPYDTKPGECYSACALAFLGGPFRFTHKGSLYGVHRFYPVPTEETITSDTAQIISAAIIEYIQAMRVNPSLFTFMTEAGSDEIKLLSEKEQLNLGVVNNGQGPTTWTVESRAGAHYLRGARETWRGMNKFLIVCTHGNLFLQILYNAERRGDEIVKYFNNHNLIIDGEYPHPLIIPMFHLIAQKTNLDSNDVISAVYKLTPEMLVRISHAHSVGIAMKPSEDAQIFAGFYGMSFADGSEKFLELLNGCEKFLRLLNTCRK
jgi:hypothetical protein